MMREQFLGAVFSIVLGGVSGWIAHDVSNLDHEVLDRPAVEKWNTIWTIEGEVVGECRVTREGDVVDVDCTPDEAHRVEVG